MPGKKFFILIFLIACFFPFFSCTSLQNPPLVKSYYNLDFIAPSPKEDPLINQGNVLLIRELLIAPEFDSHAFVYQIDENKYTADFYNEFVAYPARLITNKIAQTLYSSRHFTPFLAQKKQSVSFRLSGKITQLYADIRPGKSPQTFLEIVFILEKKGKHSFEKVFSQAYLERQTLSSSSPDDLIFAWSKGLNTIAVNLLTDIERQSLF